MHEHGDYAEQLVQLLLAPMPVHCMCPARSGMPYMILRSEHACAGGLSRATGAAAAGSHAVCCMNWSWHAMQLNEEGSACAGGLSRAAGAAGAGSHAAMPSKYAVSMTTTMLSSACVCRWTQQSSWCSWCWLQCCRPAQPSCLPSGGSATCCCSTSHRTWCRQVQCWVAQPFPRSWPTAGAPCRAATMQHAACPLSRESSRPRPADKTLF